MSFFDISYILQWWLLIFVIGLIFLPLTNSFFSSFFDKGYIFSKILGIVFLSYLVFIFGIAKILPFTNLTIILILFGLLIFNLFLIFKCQDILTSFKRSLKIFLFEEFLFMGTLFFWSLIRGFQPDIYGLEKYMDFGFVNSILRSEYFPPKDMWFTPLSINYYYFGHLVTAVLTKLSGMPSFIAYNLMLATLFALTFTEAFSIGINLINSSFKPQITNHKQTKNSNFENWKLFGIWNLEFGILLSGLLTGFLVTLAGNLHAIYAFFKPYLNDNPLPFWQLLFSPQTFPNSYWYPNATRFIYNTIHEFPIYSFIVSDLHGHVLDIPIVLLTITILFSLIFNFQFSIFNKIKNYKNSNLFQISNFKFQIILIGFLLAVMYMTNVWDGMIYLLLTIFIFLILKLKLKIKTSDIILAILLILSGFLIFSFPFSLNFKPFASGIGILCAPDFLTNIGKIGPFLFEKDHCQRSPWWQLLTLYGFFYFWAISFFLSFIKKKSFKPQITNHKQTKNSNFENWKLFGIWNLEIGNLSTSDFFILLLIILSTLLIIIPEFIYIKDIYPAHYRANTMFKLVYQAFIMLSLSSGYIMVRRILNINPLVSLKARYQKSKIFDFSFTRLAAKRVFLIFAFLFFILVSIYPYFAINSYYGNLKKYRGLNGLNYLQNLHPLDYEAILWINENIKEQPVILEAQGDSYTDFARISANTGLPTVLGWVVHEWLWRGTYDIPAPRISEVQTLYETNDINLTKNLIKKYKISFVYLGDLEYQKYQKINEQKFQILGKIIYQNGKTKIYQLLEK